MKQYLDVLKDILENGKKKSDPQGVGNIARCGYQMRFSMDDGFPLITERSLKGSWKAIVAEMLWFLSGSTHIEDLHKYGVHVWDQWVTAEICASLGLSPGELGPLYGKQWRAFNGGKEKPIDQISTVIEGLKRNPDSRRHLVTSWNPAEIDDVFIAPCHGIFHLFHSDGVLDLHLFQRSADVPVGVPFNIAGYSLLLLMIAQVTGLKAGELVHTLSDAHIYMDQIESIKVLLIRDPRPLPRVTINPEVQNILEFRPEDFILERYDPHPSMKIPVAL